ncbi:MAG: hypothetical protein HC880_12245 [Bacteroidia bacterium]|nr:hypothetical protein [Bacteroidia bacterium]
MRIKLYIPKASANAAKIKDTPAQANTSKFDIARASMDNPLLSTDNNDMDSIFRPSETSARCLAFLLIRLVSILSKNFWVNDIFREADKAIESGSEVILCTSGLGACSTNTPACPDQLINDKHIILNIRR